MEIKLGKMKEEETKKITKKAEAGREWGDQIEYRAGNQFLENRIEREWLSTKEAAHYLRLSENALRIMVHRGQVRTHRFGRRLRFQLSDCQALFRKEGT
ncbi:MAG: helix-turn-helix domain-containing protein [Cryobacterium sp.]|nr:helix-turn-helix domain-containing protein [Oligoflexia bacterium]